MTATYVVCARVSPATGRENDGASLLTQTHDLVAFAQRNGGTVRAVVACGKLPDGAAPEPGWEHFPTESGGDDLADRPGLLRAMALAQKGDVLLFAKPDRLARRPMVYFTVEEDLKRRGIRLAFVGMPEEDNPETELLRGVLALFAAYERERIKLRTLRGKRESMANGGRWGGEAPFGMRYRDGRLEVCERELACIKQVIQALGLGFTHRSIRSTTGSPRMPGRQLGMEVIAKIAARDLHPDVLSALEERT